MSMCCPDPKNIKCLPIVAGKINHTFSGRRNKQEHPQGIFDGASQGNPIKGGAGGILYLSSNHSISFKAGIGQETNNFCQMMALKLVLRLAKEFGVTHFQIFDDSMLVIQWMREEIAARKFTLQASYDEVLNLLTRSSYISLAHIYRDRNTLADGLSKAGVRLE